MTSPLNFEKFPKKFERIFLFTTYLIFQKNRSVYNCTEKRKKEKRRATRLLI